MANPMMHENVWFDKYRVDDAEKAYQEHRAREVGGLVVQTEAADSGLAGQIARARQNIQNTLNAGVGLGIGVAIDSPELAARLSAVERENAELRQVTADLQEAVKMLTARVNALDKSSSGAPPAAASKAPAKRPVPVDDDDDDDDEIDLFGSEDEDEKEALAEMAAKRKAAEASKKKEKPAFVAKSNIVLDVKPWDDETDMNEIEKAVRSIETDGLLWGASKLVPLAYGIKKLQICCIVEDEKVGTDYLEEEITKFDELVQSVDIAGFNKV